MVEQTTKWPFSAEEIARMQASVQLQLAQTFPGRYLPKEYPPEEISEEAAKIPLIPGVYEKSFFAGTTLGRWELGRVNWGGNKTITRWQVYMGTESADPRKRGFLAATIGRYGEVHDFPSRCRVY